MNSGDRMTQPEFHAACQRAPKGFKVELIGGIVYVSPPVTLSHGTNHGLLAMPFGLYCCDTPGVEFGDNTTVILGEGTELQPDVFLRIRPEYGGQSGTDEDQFVKGGPELVAEVPYSSREIDLHRKREDYTQGGVGEYLVVSLEDETLYWFDLTLNQQRPQPPDGVYRVQRFPGLWIDAGALFAKDYQRLTSTLQQCLSSAEHQSFVERLAAAKSINGPGSSSRYQNNARP